MLRSLLTSRWLAFLGIAGWLAAGLALAALPARQPRHLAALPLTCLGWFVSVLFLAALSRNSAPPARVGRCSPWVVPALMVALSAAIDRSVPADGVGECLHRIACFLGGLILYLFASALIGGLVVQWAHAREEGLGLFRPRPFDPNDPRQHPPFRLR